MSQITTPRELRAAFPYMFARPIDQWAFAFARGWFPIIVHSCEAIDALVRVDQYQHRFHWEQIKEKFGTLRLHWHARGRGVANASGRDGLVAAQIAEIVRAAEAQSAHTCIVCGSAGTLRPNGWALTLCDEHARQSEQGKRLEISFRSELFGFDWDSTAIPAVPLRTRHRAVARFHQQLEWWAWYQASLEGLGTTLAEVQTLAAGAPVRHLDPRVRDQMRHIVSACREVERLARTADQFDRAVAGRILRQAGCKLSDESGLQLRLPEIRDIENTLERALVCFASPVLGGLVQPPHTVRGGLLLAQSVLLFAGADPLNPRANTTGAELAAAVDAARESRDATQLMLLLASWHSEIE